MNTYAAAARFLTEQARPLERALFQFHFAGGPREEVLRELATYQNPDGGFGHGSEPDLRTPDSSVIATRKKRHVAYRFSTTCRAPHAKG